MLRTPPPSPSPDYKYIGDFKQCYKDYSPIRPSNVRVGSELKWSLKKKSLFPCKFAKSFFVISPSWDFLFPKIEILTLITLLIRYV